MAKEPWRHITGGGGTGSGQGRVFSTFQAQEGHPQALWEHLTASSGKRLEPVSTECPLRSHRTEDRPCAAAWGDESCPGSRGGRLRRYLEYDVCLREQGSRAKPTEPLGPSKARSPVCWEVGWESSCVRNSLPCPL